MHPRYGLHLDPRPGRRRSISERLAVLEWFGRQVFSSGLADVLLLVGGLFVFVALLILGGLL